MLKKVKRFLFVLFGFILLIVVGNSIVIGESSESCDYYSVTANKLNIRDFSGIDSKIIGTLQKNDRVCIHEFTDNWAYIENNGWINNKYISKIPESTLLSEYIAPFFLLPLMLFFLTKYFFKFMRYLPSGSTTTNNTQSSPKAEASQAPKKEKRQISYAEFIGNAVRVVDQHNRPMYTQGCDELLGYTSSTVTIRKGNTIYVFDETGKSIRGYLDKR